MALLARKTAILAKIETTYGTDSIPTGAANAVLVSNLNLSSPMATDYAARDLVRPYFGNSENLPNDFFTTVEFEVEMAGSGVAGTAPAYAPLLRACGFAETINAGVSAVYGLISSSIPSLTIYFNVDGVLHALTGARGTVTTSLTVKQIPKFRFTFMGLYQEVIDSALPSATYSAYRKPLTVSKVNTQSFSLHGFSPCMSSLELSLNNEMVNRALINCVKETMITDRKPTGSVTIEAPTVAEKDYWDIVASAATGALSIVHGIGAGNIVQISAPMTQLTTPQYNVEDGIQMLQMALIPVPSTSGNDEIVITVR